VGLRLRVRFVDCSFDSFLFSHYKYNLLLWLKNVLESVLRCAGTPPEIELSIPSSSAAPPGRDARHAVSLWCTIRQRIKNLGRSVQSVEELRRVIE
jgi:hypothetical protein